MEPRGEAKGKEWIKVKGKRGNKGISRVNEKAMGEAKEGEGKILKGPIIGCFQETHLIKEQGNSEGWRLFESGWRSSWSAGRSNSEGTGVRGGVGIVSSGIRVDYGFEVDGVIHGRQGGGQDGCDWSMGLVQMEAYKWMLVNVYMDNSIGGKGVNL